LHFWISEIWRRRDPGSWSAPRGDTMSDCPRSILVAIDFGDASGRAVSIAGALAQRCGSALRLLYAGAFDAPPYVTADQARVCKDRHDNQNRATQCVTDFGRQHTTYAFTPVVDIGAPVDTILRESETADLVAMGTHGRRGPSRWWLGSVAERVLREIACPLLIARAEAKASRPEDVFRRALVYASAPLSSVETTRYAHSLVDSFNGEVVDAHYEPLEPALERTAATLLAVAAPVHHRGAWLFNIGEPIVRFCERPIVFVQESSGDRSAVS
jgi:nucleotide-binding universal stress UspA family protein